MTFRKHEIEWTKTEISRIWDYYSTNHSYDGQYFGYLAGDSVAKYLNRKVGLYQFGKILDYACGRGDIIGSCLNHLSNDQEIYGLDISDESVAYANSRFANKLMFKGAILTKKLPSNFSSGFFDLVIATEIIEHLNDEDLNDMLLEARRLLKENGTIFITTPNNEDYSSNKVMCPECGCIFHRWQHVRTWTYQTLQTKMEEYGFRTEWVSPIRWGSIIERFASFIGLVSKNNLVYVGKK